MVLLIASATAWGVGASMVITVAEPAAARAFEQLPAVLVGGLPPGEAGQLLRAAAGTPVDDRVVARILADTEANPLALIEVGTEFTAEELAGQAVLPGPTPLTRRVADRFLRQAEGLEPATRVFLLLAAAEADGDRAVLWWAAREDGIDADRAAAEAESAGLIELSAGSVRFRYPLIRSAAYHSATDRDRRRAHLLLSAATNPGRDPDLRAWHRGAAATAPDEGAAAELEAAAAARASAGGLCGQGRDAAPRGRADRRRRPIGWPRTRAGQGRADGRSPWDRRGSCRSGAAPAG
jgi:hypothetical protein